MDVLSLQQGPHDPLITRGSPFANVSDQKHNIFKTQLGNDCQTLSRPVVNVWESLSLRIGYAKAVLVGVPGLQLDLSRNYDFH
jgi:hypothetical protein